MYEELWQKDGFERLSAIDELPLMATGEICRRYKKCGRCPLGVRYTDIEEHERVLCVDIATRRRVENALRYGGQFVKEGDK